MSKYLRNNVKLLAIAGIMASVLVFSPVLSAIALAEGTEVAEASATTEATASTESSAATTEATATTETTAAASTDDDSDAEAVGSYMGADGIMREIHIITEKIIFHQLFQVILRVFLLAAMFSVRDTHW